MAKNKSTEFNLKKHNDIYYENLKKNFNGFLKSPKSVFAKNISATNNEQLKFTGTKKVKIVSMGCGLAEELPVLMEIFEDKLEYIGIDINKEVIDKPKKLFRVKRNVNFFNIDGADVEKVKKLVGANSADFIIVRHPKFDRTTFNSFKNIFKKTLPAIAKEKCDVLVSNYFKHEVDTLFSKGLMGFNGYTPLDLPYKNEEIKIVQYGKTYYSDCFVNFFPSYDFVDALQKREEDDRKYAASVCKKIGFFALGAAATAAAVYLSSASSEEINPHTLGF